MARHQSFQSLSKDLISVFLVVESVFDGDVQTNFSWQAVEIKNLDDAG